MNKVSPAQQEQLQTIGAYLQDVRREQDKSVDDIANQTFIRPPLIKAIEVADWEALPEPVFIQGFIRRYADALGLDGLAIAKQFEATPVAVLPQAKLANRGGLDGVVAPQDRHGLKVLSKAETARSATTVAQRTTGAWKGWLGIPAIALVVAGSVWAVTQNMPRTASLTPATTTEATDVPTEEPETAEVSESPTVAEDNSASPSETTPAGGTSAPITFQVNMEGDSWMRVIADGSEVYEGTLTTGAQQSWTAQNELQVRVGDAGAVLYSFNGSSETPLGEPGRVSNLTLTPDTDPQGSSVQ
ncbi:MAG: RodZ domain-containing protein [Cyanobacteria bacterium J06638_28]